VIAPGNRYQLVTVQKGKASHLPVELVASHDDFWEVKGPLEAGMPVVVEGNERLRPGQPVKVLGEKDEKGKDK
jgi:multidrug efflux pump subunit AcrA (membrane-fusion protein)